MLRKTLAVLIALAPLVHAAERPPFPDEYTPSPCAPTKGVCASFKRSEIAQWGARVQGVELKSAWLDRHWNELIAAYEPYCAKLASCYAMPGNINLFCDEVILNRTAPICDRFPAGSTDREQCMMFIKTWGTGIQINSHDAWRAAQECAAQNPPGPLRKLDVWTEPATLPPGFSGRVTVYAIDAETHVPVMAEVKIGNETLYVDGPGAGVLTGYPVKWKSKPILVRNAQGRRDAVPPQVKVTHKHYEPVWFAMPLVIPKMIVEMTPPASALKRGKNTVTFSVRDAETGKPIDARIMLGDTPIGDIGLRDVKPAMVIELARGQKRPEIWASSPFDAYSDVIIAPAEK